MKIQPKKTYKIIIKTKNNLTITYKVLAGLSINVYYICGLYGKLDRQKLKIDLRRYF